MTRLFVTASGTDIGKTFVTAALAAHCHAAGRTVRALKPVISGFDGNAGGDGDTAQLLAATGLAWSDEAVQACSPWRFAAPLSPDMAAAREGRQLDLDAIVAWTRTALAGPEDTVLVEGVGGVMVPLNERHLVLDWIAAVEVPAVLVVGSYLGTISHTLTALSVLESRGIRVRAVVISASTASPVPLEETARTIGRFTKAPILLLPRSPDLASAGAHLSSLVDQ